MVCIVGQTDKFPASATKVKKYEELPIIVVRAYIVTHSESFLWAGFFQPKIWDLMQRPVITLASFKAAPVLHAVEHHS